jgi:hypothetical protein
MLRSMLNSSLTPLSFVLRREFRFASTVIVHTCPMQSAVVRQTAAPVSTVNR